MNIRTYAAAFRAASFLVIVLTLSACGNSNTGSGAGNGGSVKSLLPINSGAQGAQAATAGIHVGQGVATVGVKLHDLADSANTTINTLPGVGFIPLTFDCDTKLPVLFGRPTTPNSVTIVKDSATVITATFNGCRLGSTLTQGGVTVAGGAPLAVTLGSAAAPVTLTEFEGPLSPVVKNVFVAAATVSFSKGAAADTLVVTGSIDNTDSVRHTHERFDLDNVSITLAKTTTVIGVDAYDVASLTVNGALTKTAFVSDIDPAVRLTQSDVFTDFGILFKTPAAGAAATAEFLTVNGRFSIATTPPAQCIDGTFAVATTVEVQIDKATGAVSAGQIGVNGLAVATFNPDGGASVSIAGGAPESFAGAGLTALCVV
jgi:hypothetical protein